MQNFLFYHWNVKNVNNIKHDIIRESLRLFNIKNGIELTTIADIPRSKDLLPQAL